MSRKDYVRKAKTKALQALKKNVKILNRKQLVMRKKNAMKSPPSSGWEKDNYDASEKTMIYSSDSDDQDSVASYDKLRKRNYALFCRLLDQKYEKLYGGEMEEKSTEEEMMNN